MNIKQLWQGLHNNRLSLKGPRSLETEQQNPRIPFRSIGIMKPLADSSDTAQGAKDAVSGSSICEGLGEGTRGSEAPSGLVLGAILEELQAIHAHLVVAVPKPYELTDVDINNLLSPIPPEPLPDGCWA